ncbi:uncharacterized protein LOC143035702 isoform X2 [Oratosquilla oratoria]|uniref:uncharacterized protein LOC143035702 isoform X2 n=1 Tax=Oratosquilla oratoria TaxID=337810 RepID=UPI003F7682A9
MKLKENKFSRGLTQRSRRKLYRRLQGTTSLENLLKDEPAEDEAAAEAVGRNALVEGRPGEGAEGVKEGAKVPAGGQVVKKGDDGEDEKSSKGREGTKEEGRKGKGQVEKNNVTTTATEKKEREVLIEVKNSKHSENSDEEVEEEEEGVEEKGEDVPLEVRVEVVEDLDLDITLDVDVEVAQDVTAEKKLDEKASEVRVLKRDVAVEEETSSQKDTEMSSFARELNSLWTFEVNERLPDATDEPDGVNETGTESCLNSQEAQLSSQSSPNLSSGSETDETKKNTTSASSEEGVSEGLVEEKPAVVGDDSKDPVALADKLGRMRPSNISFKIRRRKKESDSLPRPSQVPSTEQRPPSDDPSLPLYQSGSPSNEPPQPPPRTRRSAPGVRTSDQTSNKSQRLLDSVLTKNLRNLRVGGVSFPKGRRHSSTPAPQTALPPTARDRKTSVTYIKEILRDLRQGLLRTEERPLRETAVFYTKDDTYMYDDEVGGAMGGATGVMGGAMGGAGVMGSAMGGVPISGPMGLHLQHWYDEPPYESDPEDFLIGKDPVREPYVNNFRVGIKEEDVISLRTAGDISVPRDVTKASHVYWSTVGAAGPGSNTSSSMSSSSSRHPHGHHTHVHAQQHTHWLEMEMEGGRRLCTPYGPQPVYDNVRLAAYTGSGPACIRPGNYPRRMAGPAVAGPISGPDPEYHNLMALRTCQGAPGLGGGRRGVGVGVGGRESMGGDYASDVQSVTSRLSAISVETNRSDPTDLRLSKYTTMMDAAVLKPQRLSPAYTPLRILLEDPEADDLCTSASIPLVRASPHPAPPPL